MAKKKLPNLVQIIRDNPGCVAQIDNDHWILLRAKPENNPHDYDDEDEGAAAERWDEDNVIAEAGGVEAPGDGGYGSGDCYGGDILQALAEIVGIKVESV